MHVSLCFEIAKQDSLNKKSSRNDHPSRLHSFIPISICFYSKVRASYVVSFFKSHRLIVVQPCLHSDSLLHKVLKFIQYHTVSKLFTKFQIQPRRASCYLFYIATRSYILELYKRVNNQLSVIECVWVGLPF